MIFAVLSDNVLQAIIVGVVAIVQALIAAALGVVMVWVKRGIVESVEASGKATQHTVAETGHATQTAVIETSKAVAKEVANKTTVVEEKIDEIARIGALSHDLSNSASLNVKRLLAEASRGKADATGNVGDIALAGRDEQAYKAHLAGQIVADKKEKEAAAMLAEAKLVAADKLAGQPKAVK